MVFKHLTRMSSSIKNSSRGNHRGGHGVQRDHRTGTLIQPLAKAMAKMTKGVAMPKMMMYGKGVFIGFSPSLSPAVCQYLHHFFSSTKNLISMDSKSKILERQRQAQTMALFSLLRLFLSGYELFLPSFLDFTLTSP